MTKQEAIEIINRACVEANPSIMDLTFGCEVVKSDMHSGVVVGEAYEQIAYLNYGEMKVFLAPKEQFEILGRPITIADVLVAMAETVHREQVTHLVTCYGDIRDTHFNLKCSWNLLRDNLSLQSDETLVFLAGLLKK